jgi:hypothetical protein
VCRVPQAVVGGGVERDGSGDAVLVLGTCRYTERRQLCCQAG